MRLFLIALLLLGGCASGIRVTYHSEPEGATLYQRGQPMGITPVTLTYPPTDGFTKGLCQQNWGTDVRWASGATASISSISLCSAQGWNQTFTFVRPDVPGREIDANFALQLRRNAIMEQQARNQALANYMNYVRSIQPPPPRNCTSVVNGSFINTTCY